MVPWLGSIHPTSAVAINAPVPGADGLNSPSPADLRWFWSVDPRAGICASGKGHDRAGWLHAVRLIRLILWMSSSNGVRNKNQPKMTRDGVQATIIPSRNA